MDGKHDNFRIYKYTPVPVGRKVHDDLLVR